MVRRDYFFAFLIFLAAVSSPAQILVTPTLDCVRQNADGSYDAEFGYDNPGAIDVLVPVGLVNRFSPAPEDRGQPSVFHPGRYPSVITLRNLSGTLTWNLLTSSATATGAETTYCSPELPPDPSTVAPPIDQTVPTTTFHSTRFLYEGADPIQTNVAPGAIEPARAMVIRGRLLQRNGQALSGVRVSIKDRSELGETLSRIDGRFDFVANGGGLEILRLEKAGYIPADRQIPSGWGEDVHTGDIALIPYDSIVTEIRSNESAMQVARGSVMSDADGSRRATLLFAAGTEAAMVLPSGTTQLMAALDIRATEYTVGDTGRAAMPADLPPQSGYTYCVELSADEAVAAGATSVTFSKPVIVYLENFLNFPVGGAVPVGYYDRLEAAWIPSDDGRVVKILGIELGLAYLDVNGNGVAADAPTLAAMGITDAEREKLAQMYGEGQSLWRTRVNHFTPWDFNWPFGVPSGAAAPLMPTPSTDYRLPRPDVRCGSIIDCQNQALGEAFAIDGTPVSLHYRSDRMPGRTLPFTINIPVSGETLPPGVLQMVVEIRVAGRKHVNTFAPSLNHTYTFTWDGLDAYGRETQGRQRADIRIGYVYRGNFQIPAEVFQSFGALSGAPLAAQLTRTSEVVTLPQEHVVFVGNWGITPVALGGWSASLVHSYDPQTRMLYLGNGEERSATASGNVIAPFAGTGTRGYTGDGGSALEAQIGNALGLAVADDGTLFLADTIAVRKVAPDGTISTVAGSGTAGFSGDGGPATAAQLRSPQGVAAAPDGTVYIADSGNHRIRKVTVDGVIETFAGTGTAGLSGDGGLATSAQLRDPSGVAVGPDGSVYVADEDNHRVRRISRTGIITTVAGAGGAASEGDLGDGGPAYQSKLYFPEKVTIGPDGSIYISTVEPGRIRRVGTNGIITTVAGDGLWDNLELEGVPATSVSFVQPWDVAVDRNGNVFTMDTWSHKVFQVRTDGILVRVAGNGANGDAGDYGPPRSASIEDISTLALAPNGDLYVASWTGSARVRKISRAFPGLGAGEMFVPSESGSEIFVFNEDLRHVRTVDSLTSVVVWSFGYDAAGRLVIITDRDGEITRIERNGSGAPTAIVAPRGQRTALTLSPAGLLEAISDPAGETREFTYDTGGLLTSYTTPNQHQYSFQYDSDGRLTRHDDPAGGSMTLTRSGTARDFLVTLITAEGRTTLYDVEDLPTGLTRLRNTFPSGLTTESLAETSGARTVTSPTGMVLTETLGPDTRFGIQSPVRGFSLTTPAGRTMSIERERTTALLDPANPLSVDYMWDWTTVNGKLRGHEYYASDNLFYDYTPEGRYIEVYVDAKARPERVAVPGIHEVSYTRDALGQLTTITQDSRVTRFNWTSLGELESIVDPLQRTVSFGYDDAGRVISQLLPDFREIRFTYDANGNLTSVTPPTRPPHDFTFTEVDLGESYTPPPETSTGLNLTRYVWNLDKDLTEIVRPDGSSIDFAYDQGGRLQSVTSPTGTTTVSYNAVTGMTAGVSAPGGETLAYTWDGALPLSTSWSGTVSGTVGWAWDNDFRVTSETAGGASVPFGYDDDGLVTSAGPMTLSYDGSNGLLLSTATGGVSENWSYDLFGEMTRYTASYNNTSVFDIVYTRDAVGRITAKQETAGSTTVTDGYGYDTAGRLTTVTRDAALTSTYAYDGNSNRLSHVTSTDTNAGTYDTQDRMTTYGGATYSYTANGELLQKTEGTDVTGYEYDALGNLREATLPDGTLIEYVIDGENRRVGKKVNGVLVQGFLYAGALQVVAELDGANSIVSRFVYARGANVPDLMIRGGVTYRMIPDQLGSVRLVVDIATGAVAQQIEYDEFGNVTGDSNPGFQPFGFAGGLYDRETELVRFGARDFDPETGRWTAKDLIRFGGGDANLYGYVFNDPVNFLDRAGRQAQSATTVAADTAAQAGAAAGVMIANFAEMIWAWTIGVDKYYHCMANCEAARMGPFAAAVATAISDVREYYDHQYQGQSLQACAADQFANRTGRNSQNQSCESACARFLPRGFKPPKVPFLLTKPGFLP